MRRDTLDIVRALKKTTAWRYVAIITNGWFLTDERCRALVDTGIDQINVSMCFPDERQDAHLHVPGIFARLSHAVPLLVSLGANVQMNTVLMNDNLDDVVPAANLAETWGASIMYTLFALMSSTMNVAAAGA